MIWAKRPKRFKRINKTTGELEWGSCREVRRFAWLPISSGNLWIWLEHYTQNQELIREYDPSDKSYYYRWQDEFTERIKK